MGDGYYDFEATITIDPTAAGEITATLYNNGVPIPGAVSTATTADAGSIITLPVIGAVRNTCGASSVITCALSAAATVTNFAFKARKE